VRGRLGSVLLLAASLGLTCGAAELGLRLAGYVPIHDVYSKPELFWQHDERLGWSLEPGARGRYVGPRPFPIEFDSAIEINSLGLRGPEPAPRQPGELRVLFLGDSVVAGFEVEQSETFTARLEAELRRRFPQPLAVINAGVRGYGTDQSLLWYRERGLALAPDLVVLVFSANDFDDNLSLHRARRPFGKGAFALRPSGALELVGVPVPRYELCSSWVLDAGYAPARVDGPIARAGCFFQTRLADRSALFTVLATSLARLPGLVLFLKDATDGARDLAVARAGDLAVARAGLLPWPARAAQRADVAGSGSGGESRAAREAALTTALLQALARDVRGNGSRFLLMITPRNFERLDVRALAADQIEPHAVMLSSALQPGQLRFRNDSHFNTLGHQVYAEGLVPLVERELHALLRARGVER
jgi:lysophospholipase L1-like esterase